MHLGNHLSTEAFSKLLNLGNSEVHSLSFTTWNWCWSLLGHSALHYHLEDSCMEKAIVSNGAHPNSVPFPRLKLWVTRSMLATNPYERIAKQFVLNLKRSNHIKIEYEQGKNITTLQIYLILENANDCKYKCSVHNNTLKKKTWLIHRYKEKCLIMVTISS